MYFYFVYATSIMHSR